MAVSFKSKIFPFMRRSNKNLYFSCRYYHVNRISKFFPPANMLSPGKETDKATRLMLDYGLIRHSSPGCYSLMPLALKSLSKLIGLVEETMMEIGAQRVELPNILSGNLWKTSGRWNEMGDEMFKLQDRQGKDYSLAPTHEEAFAQLIASFGTISPKQLPINLYQITTKFRDELRSHGGLIRCKQFLMKDLYTFDQTEEDALKNYYQVDKAYQKLFSTLEFDYVKVQGANNLMGGDFSHEYHVISNSGQDQLFLCPKKDFAVNEELFPNRELICPNCGTTLERKKGVELGHIFYLGTKYSKPFNAYFLKDKENKPLYMCSYGLGLTRILATSCEIFSQGDEIRWPEKLAPFLMCIIPPKAGSKEEKATSTITTKLIHQLHEQQHFLPCWKNDIVVDDRTHYTIGRRLLDARKIGYPYIVVVGRQAMELTPKIELHHLTTDQTIFLTINELIDYLNQNKTKKSISNINLE